MGFSIASRGIFVNKHRPSLLEGDIAPQLWRLSIPLTWGMFVMTSYNVIDALYISRLGTHALAALGFTIPVVTFFMGFIFGLSVGTTSCLSRTFGEGDAEKLRRLSTDALTLAALLIGAVALAGFFLGGHIFRYMGASEDLLPVIQKYMSIWYCGMVFLALVII